MTDIYCGIILNILTSDIHLKIAFYGRSWEENCMKQQNYRIYFFMAISLVACILIFHNSMYPIAQSDLQSGTVMRALNYLSVEMNLNFSFTQFAVRKLAHFTEYFLLGIILTITIWTFTKNKCIFFELFLFLAVPVADETIQIFYNGRTSSVRDVIIDFLGCLAGMALCRAIRWKARNTKKGHEGSLALKKDLSKCWIFTLITIVYVLFIFHNSMFSGPQSSSQSLFVMSLLNHVLTFFQIPGAFSEYFVRKSGHFAEFFVLGLLLTATVRIYRYYKREFLFAILFFLLLVAVCDEFIQVFIPLRGSSVTDVLLDFGSGVISMLLYFFVSWLRNRNRQNL